MVTTDLIERTSDKAFSKLLQLQFEIERLEKDYAQGLTSGITLEQLQGVIDHTKREHEIWNYITSLMEKNNT